MNIVEMIRFFRRDHSLVQSPVVCVIGAFLCSLAGPAEVAAQFSYSKIKDSFAYQQPRQISYYSHSRFNRVEGFALNVGVKYQPQKLEGLSLAGDVTYGFKNLSDDRLKYNATLQKDLFLPNRLSFGVALFDEVHTRDTWSITTVENSLAAIFSHHDYMDYVGREGFKLFIDYKLAQVHNVRLELGRYNYNPLSVLPNSNWSLFNKDAVYAANPQFYPLYMFQEGRETSLRLMGNIDLRDNPIFPIIGWYFEGIFEKTFDDFETNGLFLTVKRFQPSFGNQRAMAKVLFGTRSGSFAYQHLISFGGVGAMRGYNNKEFVGNRALFGSFQYAFGGDLLQNIPLHSIPVWEALSLGLFFDIGYGWFADKSDPDVGLFKMGEFSMRDLKSNVGISLIVTEGLLRFDFGKRTDYSGSDWQVFMRILEKF